MNNLKRWFPILIGGGLVTLLLVSFLAIAPVFAQGPGGMMGRGMGRFGFNGTQSGSYSPGWMRGNAQGDPGTAPCGYGSGWMSGANGPGGMMGHGMMGNFGFGGMMWNSNSPFFKSEPLTLAQATEAVNTYLAELSDSNLQLSEVMIFDNHAYAQIIEKDTGIGAMELLIDPTTQAVYPEMGPNMMWNLKYGMMSGFGHYGMMGRYGYNPSGSSPSAEMSITPAEAIEAAQAYLDTYFGGDLTADEHADRFYGYYTLHVNRDGQTVGMLSVNGYTGQVFLHTWHGQLLEMSEEVS